MKTTVNIYLTFDGQCEEAFNFYKSVFGGNFTFMGRFSEMPPQEGMPPMPEEDAKKIMHVSLPISEETILMGSDSAGQWKADLVKGNNFSISVNTGSIDEAKRIFNDLSKGGKVTMPLDKTFWEAYFGMLTDKFGINWQVNHELSEHKQFEETNKN